MKKSEDEVYRIWFERPLPAKYTQLLYGKAVAAGPATATPDMPLVALPGAHAIIASSRIRYDGVLMDQVPTLRVISRTGIGYDNVSIPEATARGIAVTYVPDGPTISTAEHAITLILAVAKHLKQSEALLRRGGKRDYFTEFSGVELNGLTLGLIGVGRIGGHVAKVALALGMVVKAYDPYVQEARARALGVELKPTLEGLLCEADFVSVHAPLSAATRHLMNAERFLQMKRGAYLINTARGGLVDEAALIQALDSGQLAGAGLDVFDPEPPRAGHPLLHRDNVIATPHIAGATSASKDRLWRSAIEQTLQVLQGEHPPNLLNPEVWPKLVEKSQS